MLALEAAHAATERETADPGVADYADRARQPVLLRGAEPVEGVVEDPRRLAGPGLLCLAMGITTAQTDLDLVRSPLSIRDAPRVATRAVSRGARIGLSAGATFAEPWRFWVTGSRGVSPR